MNCACLDLWNIGYTKNNQAGFETNIAAPNLDKALKVFEDQYPQGIPVSINKKTDVWVDRRDVRP